MVTSEQHSPPRLFYALCSLITDQLVSQCVLLNMSSHFAAHPGCATEGGGTSGVRQRLGHYDGYISMRYRYQVVDLAFPVRLILSQCLGENGTIGGR